MFWNGFLAYAHAAVTGFMVHGGTWNGFLVVVLANRPYDHVKLFMQHLTCKLLNKIMIFKMQYLYENRQYFYVLI
jgi:hypothetical protein